MTKLTHTPPVTVTMGAEINRTYTHPERHCTEPDCQRAISEGFICQVCESRLQMVSQINALKVALGKLLDGWFFAVDSGDVYVHVIDANNNPHAALLPDETAVLARQAQALLAPDEDTQS